MREIVLDTETTGLDPATGHRIVEIGAVELQNHIPTGRSFHVHINPDREVPAEAEAVHGLSTAFLRDKPVFAAISASFEAFIEDSTLVIHNASFDIGFINAELGYLSRPAIRSERVIDTLMLARQKHPGSSNSLDALCRRYGVDNSRRTKHGALLDSELLAEVYLELIGGRQTALALTEISRPKPMLPIQSISAYMRRAPLPGRLDQADREAHANFVAALGDEAVWKQFER